MKLENDIWDLKYYISEFIIPRLELYIEKVSQNEIQSIPNWIENTKKISHAELNKEWADILKDMLFPFQYEYYPNDFAGLDKKEIKMKYEKGLELFSKYFIHLWD